jgi:hypothetical protein
MSLGSGGRIQGANREKIFTTKAPRHKGKTQAEKRRRLTTGGRDDTDWQRKTAARGGCLLRRARCTSGGLRLRKALDAVHDGERPPAKPSPKHERVQQPILQTDGLVEGLELQDG